MPKRKCKYKHSDETKIKMSQKRIQFFKNGGEHPRGMLNKKAWNYKGEKFYCLDCGKEIWYGKKRCKKCARKGSLNPNWKNGKSFEIYPIEWTISIRDYIRDRDDYTCQLCGSIQQHIKLSIHHIDYNKQNCNQKNLISLCKSCHIKTNFNREYWINYFTNKLKNMDISKLNLTELKSLAYDTIAEVERTQKNLSVINNEIAKKANSEVAEPLTKEQGELIAEEALKEENARGASEPEKTKEDNKTNKKQ